ncbi:MAG: hypothetical protein IKA16_01825 [Oscillospiraceae bacterium]|nr:hypothetical protein [Oscillospiraceae bacterium]
MFFDTKNHLMYGTEPFCECAQDEDMAFCMAFEAYTQGCRFIMATPPSAAFLDALTDSAAEGIPASISERYKSLRSRIRYFLPKMELGLGCEITCSRSEVENVIYHLKKKHLPTLNNSPYVLVSFPVDITREDLWFCLDRLDKEGYHPVLSHAQNIYTLKHDIHEIKCLKGEAPRDAFYQFRCLIQLDTFSLHFSEDNSWPREMIRSGVVDVMATNARNTFTNPPHIREEIESISNICTPDYLQAITWGNASWLFRPSVEGE